MHLSSWLKGRGETVKRVQMKGRQTLLPTENVEKVWLSSIFKWSRELSGATLRFYNSLGIECEAGGSGVSLRWNLPEEVESLHPDYALYGDDRAIGFVQRGCIRACSFCDVHAKEGWLKDNVYRPLESWVPDGLDKILLLDNEFAACPHEFEVLDTVRRNKWKLSITQGYDLRCVTREKAEKLAENKPWDLKFRKRRLYTAWDYFYIEPYVRKGIEILKDAGFKTYDRNRKGQSELMVYCLVGFNTTHEQDWHRVRVLLDEYGVAPFIMRYNLRRDDFFLNHLGRYCNRGPILYRNWSFEQYCERYAPSLVEEARRLGAS